MPKCAICDEFLPPFLCEKTPDDLAHKCLFCKIGKKEIEYEKDGRLEKLTKEYAVKEYNQYLTKLVNDNKTIKEIVKGIKEDNPVK
jgi:hypothetical protein